MLLDTNVGNPGLGHGRVQARQVDAVGRRHRLLADGRLESRVGDAGEGEAVVGLKGEVGQLVSVGQDAGRRSQVRLESTRSVFEQEGRARSIQGHSKLKREVLGR